MLLRRGITLILLLFVGSVFVLAQSKRTGPTKSSGAVIVQGIPPSPSYWADKAPNVDPGMDHGIPAVLFPSDNWWHQDISGAPVDSNSAFYIGNLSGVSIGFDFDGANYGIPYSVVGGGAYPQESFQGASYWSETDQVPYSIPIAAKTVPGWTEQATVALNDIEELHNGDRHLLVVDLYRHMLFEMYQPYWNDTVSQVEWWPTPGTYVQPGNYYMASGSVWDYNTNNTRTPGWTSSDAAGLQVLPGLLTYDDATSGTAINHAIRMTLNLVHTTGGVGCYVWPATHGAGCSNDNHPPLGARFRLKASVDTSLLGPYCNAATQPAGAKLVAAYKKYGVIVADNGVNGLISGTRDARWGTYAAGFSQAYIEMSNAMTCLVNMSGDSLFNLFELVELGWTPTLNITTTSLPDGTNGVAYSQQVCATGGYNNYTFTKASGSYPTGLNMTSGGTCATISGTPSGTGTFNFTIHVADAHTSPWTDDQALSITVN